MIYSFGKTSTANLNTANFRLRKIMQDALAVGLIDFAILDCYRDKENQNSLYTVGKSRVEYPNSKHNKIPSDAVDAVPFINGASSWNRLHCCFLAGIVLTCAKNKGIKIRWGGNWNMDGEPITDQDFQDLVHYEEV